MDYYPVLIVFIVTVILVGLYYIVKSLEKFSQQAIQTSKSCFTDDECGPNQFCYLGRCFGYYYDNSMPWNSCRNPYYQVVPGSFLTDDGSAEPGCGCREGKECTCSPYCKCKTIRGPGGAQLDACFPTCGDACTDDSDCPKGCPQCVKGTCQPPFNPNFQKYRF